MSDGNRYDMVVIGAGILGAGVAQAASAAGYRTLVLERSAPAAGTSSRSSKLIHGGLRYLESGQFGLVREALREQALLLRNAPDLVHPLPFFLPVYRHNSRRPLTIMAGLAFYALLGSRPGFRRIDWRSWENPDNLDTRDLQALFVYQDARTDDAALTRAVLGSALSLGARLECPAEATAVVRLAEGYRIDWDGAGRAGNATAGTLIVAAGPWTNDVLRRIYPAVPALPLDLVQGAHIVLRGRLRAGGYYVEARPDRRGVFILPWADDTTLVGTTETPFSGDPDTVHALPDEIAYLRETAARHLPAWNGEPQADFAGLRVLPRTSATPFGRSRETLLAVDEPRAPRLVSLCGGKLTTYRATAEKVLERLRHRLPPPATRIDTRQLRLNATTTQA